VSKPKTEKPVPTYEEAVARVAAAETRAKRARRACERADAKGMEALSELRAAKRELNKRARADIEERQS
jgi:hypothetical protein